MIPHVPPPFYAFISTTAHSTSLLPTATPARVKGLFGGEIKAYAEMLTDAAAEATKNLIKEAAVRVPDHPLLPFLFAALS